MLIVHHEKLLDRMRFDYALEDIERLLMWLQQAGVFEFPTLSNGLFPAAVVNPNAEYTGYSNVWLRDNVHIVHALYYTGQTDRAVKTARSLLAYFKKYRRRFEDIIESRVSAADPMHRPHVRLDGNSLEEIGQKWPHAQNDALGYCLWLFCQLAYDQALAIAPDDMDMLALFPLYFEAITYWEDEDSGHWEEIRKISASSIGVVIAGLQALRRLVTSSRVASPCSYKGKIVTGSWLDELIEKGDRALNGILPAECVQPNPRKRRLYDAALLFLIFPLEVVDQATAEPIIRNVLNQLQGDYGVRRYLGDSYWAPDYKKKLPPEQRTMDFSEKLEERAALVGEGEEAQWCLFDPIFSCIFGRMFQRTGQHAYLMQQVKHLNRALGQLTGPESPCGAFKCPEAYYLENGRYVETDTTPLLWAQANLRLALELMRESLRRQPL